MSEKDKKTFTGDDLRILRTGKNLSIAAMSRKIGCSRQSISDWENNNGKPRWDVLFDYLAVCGVSNVKEVVKEVLDLVQDYKQQKANANQHKSGTTQSPKVNR